MRKSAVQRLAMLARVLLAALAACWWAAPSWAQSATPPDAATSQVQAEAASHEEAPVVVLNRQVAVLRAPFLGMPPSTRAWRSQLTLAELLDASGPGVVSIRHDPQGQILMVDGRLALILLPGDANALRGETPEAAAQTAAQALRGVIEATREGRDHSRLLRSLWHSAVATVLCLLAAWLTWLARAWLTQRTTAMLHSGTAELKIAGAPLLPRERVGAVATGLVRLLSSLVLLLLLYEWLSYLLGQFPYTRPWGEQLNHYLLGVVSSLAHGMLRALPGLLTACIIFALARWVIKLLMPIFDRIETGRVQVGGLDADTVRPTRRIFSAAIWLFALAMAYPYLPGSQSDAFRGISVLVGVMISVGASNLFGQAASGMILMYSRTLRVGEYVRIDDHEGTVTELGAFTAKIRTGLGEELSLPNALVLGTVTKNYSRSVQGRGYVVDTVVTIGYDTPWRQVEAMLIEAAHRTPGVLDQPAPRVFQTALSDFYPEYRLVCQAVPTEPRPRAEVLDSLHANIQDVFNEHNVQIMSPHYLGDPAMAKVVPPAQWFTAPARPPPA